jgi:hypothetical protein
MLVYTARAVVSTLNGSRVVPVTLPFVRMLAPEIQPEEFSPKPPDQTRTKSGLPIASSRQEAQRLGWTRFHGSVCKKNASHGTIRKAVNGGCVQCGAEERARRERRERRERRARRERTGCSEDWLGI